MNRNLSKKNSGNRYWDRECREVYKKTKKCENPCKKIKNTDRFLNNPLGALNRYKCVPDEIAVLQHKKNLRLSNKKREPIRITIQKHKKLEKQKEMVRKLERQKRNPDLGVLNGFTIARVEGMYTALKYSQSSLFFNDLVVKKNITLDHKWSDLTVEDKMLFILFLLVELDRNILNNKTVQKMYLGRKPKSFETFLDNGTRLSLILLLNDYCKHLGKNNDYILKVFDSNLTTFGKTLGGIGLYKIARKILKNTD